MPRACRRSHSYDLKAQSLHCDYSDFSDFSPDDLSTHEVLADNSSIAIHRQVSLSPQRAAGP